MRTQPRVRGFATTLGFAVQRLRRIQSDLHTAKRFHTVTQGRRRAARPGLPTDQQRYAEGVTHQERAISHAEP